jgi:hypothetical protein
MRNTLYAASPKQLYASSPKQLYAASPKQVPTISPYPLAMSINGERQPPGPLNKASMFYQTRVSLIVWQKLISFDNDFNYIKWNDRRAIQIKRNDTDLEDLKATKKIIRLKLFSSTPQSTMQ